MTGKGYYFVFQEDDYLWQPYFEDDDCEIFIAAEAFSFGSASGVIGDGSIGTQYVWEPQNMQDRDTSDLIDAFFSGYCTVTSTTPTAGYFCHFVIVNNVGDQMTMAGALLTPDDSLLPLGTLAITGGTGGMAGVIGDMTIFANPIGTDALAIASQFDVDVLLGIIVCPSQPLPTAGHY